MERQSRSPAPHEDAGKPMRADARRNRARVLEVAEAVFTARGTSVSTEEIARQAGVGIGTVFRHFPTKESLLTAVFVGRLRRIADEAESLAEAEDAGEAVFSFFRRVVAQAAAKNSFADTLAEAGVDLKAVTKDVGIDLKEAVGVLLARAQQAGAVRDDIGVPEVMALLLGASRIAEHPGQDPDVRDRAIGVVLDGLRPTGSRQERNA